MSSESTLQAMDLVLGCRERKVLVHIAGPSVLRLAPPLIVRDQEVDTALGVLEEVLQAAAG